jgi:PAS domain S-box-containing protein
LALAALALLLALLAPATVDAASKAEPISTAYCIDCVPFQFQDENGEAAGLIIDLWRLWSEKTDIEIDFRPGQWDETLRMVRDGEAEAHAGLFYTHERAQYLDYGSYLTNTETHFFIKKGLPAIEIVEDLAAFRVGVIAGDYVEGWLKGRLPEGTVIGFESYDAIMAALRGGQLQVFAADSPTGIFHLQRAGLGFGYEYPEDRPLYQTDWLVAAAKGNMGLVETVNLGLALISDDERLEIEQRWVAVETKDFELSRREMAITAAVLAVGVIFGIVVWSVSLRRRIALRTSELLAANQASVAAEALLRDAIDNISDGFAVYDSDDRLVTSNQNWRDIYGYSDEDAAPGTAYENLIRLDIAKGLILEEDGHLEDYWRHRIEYRKNLSQEVEAPFADGRWILYHDQTTSTGGLVSIQTDITERKKAENKIRASQARLLSILEAGQPPLRGPI